MIHFAEICAIKLLPLERANRFSLTECVPFLNFRVVERPIAKRRTRKKKERECGEEAEGVERPCRGRRGQEGCHGTRGEQTTRRSHAHFHAEGVGG